MSDDAKVVDLLQRYTPEQLARAYLKASRERNVAQRELREYRAMVTMREKLGAWAERFGV